MPFVSQAQRAFMYANHPDIAKRWEALTPKGQGTKNLPEHVPSKKDDTGHVWKKGVAATPKRRDGTDFKGLTPNEVQRHKPKQANEKEAMAEGHGVEFQHGSRHTELGTPESLSGNMKRDVFSATKRLPGVKNP